MPLYRGFKEGPPSSGISQTRRVVRPGSAPPSDESDLSTVVGSMPVVEHDEVVAQSSSKIEPTRRIARPDSAARLRPESVPKPRLESPPIVNWSTGTNPANSTPVVAEPSAVIHDFLSNPVVGWLAVVAGPGRGAILPLGYGVNDIGRGAGVRIRLEFGDDQIIRKAILIYAAIIYTARSRRFYVQLVGGETLLNGRPLRESTELTGGEVLQLGQTQLRFIPLCGIDFDWRDGG